MEWELMASKTPMQGFSDKLGHQGGHPEALIIRTRSDKDRSYPVIGLEHAFDIRVEDMADSGQLAAAARKRKALIPRPEGHWLPGQATYNLAKILRTQLVNLKLGHLSDLDESINLNREVLARLPHDSLRRPQLLVSLGSSLQERYRRKGDVSDLQDAIGFKRAALHATYNARQHVDFGLALNDFASVLRERYIDLGDPNDLEECILLFQQALDTQKPPSPHHPQLLFNLAEVMTDRYKLYHQSSDLENAIKLHQQWFQQGSPHHFRSSFLVASADALHLRYARSRNDKDFQLALERYELALTHQASDHPQRHETLHHLASLMILRFSISNQVALALAALDKQQAALELVPPGHPHRSHILSGLAQLYVLDNSPYMDPSAAIEALSTALSDSNCSAQSRVHGVSSVLMYIINNLPEVKWSLEMKHSLLSLYRGILHLLPHVAYFGLDIQTRLRVLGRSETVSIDAATVALSLDQPSAAVELLEEGRAVFWTQYTRIRTRFDGLPSELGEKLTVAARNLGRGASIQAGSDNSAKEFAAAEYRRLGSEFQSLLLKVRTHPGYERFLLRDDFETLVQAAENGPVVIFVAAQDNCRAILLVKGEKSARSIVLPDVKPDDLVTLNNQLASYNGRSRDAGPDRAMRKRSGNEESSVAIFKNLWNLVLKPVVQALGYQPKQGRERPRIYLCPTGSFAHLPLHAAGDWTHGDDSSALPSFAVASYIPTLSALINARKNYQPPNRDALRALLISVANPPGWSPLPFAEQELDVVRSLLPSGAEIALPSGDVGITRQAVLDHLREASILHLACHGQQNKQNPLDSGFVMGDGMLTVPALMGLQLPHAVFAFLSACQTAKGDQERPDQAIHLAATMLFAGFKSIIGTMWSMGDVDGPLVAKTVYEGLFQRGSPELDLNAIPFALDAAVGRMRKKGLHAGRWAPYIHLGM